MRTIFLISLFFYSSLMASVSTRGAYLELIKAHPEVVMPIGNASKGEIEIVLDPEKMAQIEMTAGRDVGLVHSDGGWIWINDACRFPSGCEKVKSRILAKSLESCAGAGVLPILSDGKVVLNCQFRHSTRSWELEMPRGGVDPGENLENTARREVLEETGLIVDEVVRLGEVTGDSGITGMILAIFMARVSDSQNPNRESTEVINQNLAFSLSEIREAFAKGFIECTIEGETRRVNARDPFLAYAVSILAEISK